MQYIPPTIPIANISVANTTHDLVDRVQTIVDYLNGNPIEPSGNDQNANTAHFLVGNLVTTNTSALTLGPGASLYANGAPGTNGQILLSNGTSTYWGNPDSGDAHALLSNTHNDTNAAAVVRGDLIAGVGASPLWTKLAIGAAGYALTSNGTDPAWTASVNNAIHVFGKLENALNVNSALSANQANNSSYLNGHTEGQLNVNSALASNTANFASSANNSGYLNGHTEAQLNVNSALSANQANNSSYLNGHTEAQLNVNSALSANNSTYAFGKLEGDLNVNSALASNTANFASFANNSSYLSGHTEAQLNTNSALQANNSGYLNGHTEAQLNANSALSANDASYLNGHTEGQLNVNNALSANQANNSGYLNGHTEAQLNANSALSANNSSYLNGHTEAQLNVNNAITANTANNATYAFGKTEGTLNVNSALSANQANNSALLNTHTEAQLNVNSALGANNASFLNTHTEGQLNVNSALGANNTDYFGGQLPAFYTNSSNANTGTLPDARLSANVVRYLTAQTANFVLAGPAGANGNISFRALTANDVTNLDERIEDMNICGFDVTGSSETTISFNVSTFTVTLANTSAAVWKYYHGGIEYFVTGSRTAVLPGSPPAAGVYYIYIDGTTGANANLVVNTTVWALSDTEASVPVATVTWNNGNTPKYFFGDERHTVAMSRGLHRYLHTTRGTQYVLGGQLTGQTFSSSVNTALTFAVANTTIDDEDITHAVLGVADGDGATNNYTVMFHSNSSFYTWAPSAVPFPYTANSFIQWDNGSALVNGTSGNWYTSYVVVISADEGPGGNTGIIILPGRGEYGSQALAEAENPTAFDFTGFPIPESVILWRCTWTTQTSFGTKGHVQLKNLARVTVTISTASTGSITTDHNSLTGLQGGTTGEFFHITSAQWANGLIQAETANSANTANTANDASYLGGHAANTYLYPISNVAPTNGQTLLWNTSNSTWYPANGADPTPDQHTLLQSNIHIDTTNGTVLRGDVITGQGASPTWTRLALGANTYVLTSNGTDVVWAAPSTNGVSLNANNANYLNTHSEAQLNVNSALTANNATYAYGKTEGTLNVNSALTANFASNADMVDGHHESELNVNSALSSNNASYLSGHSEAQLNVNSALTANNTTYAFGKVESALNVNSALSANQANNSDLLDGNQPADLNVNSALSSNNASYVNGHTEAQLNVNTALVANNATYAFGLSQNQLNVNSALSANVANNSTYAYGKLESALNVNSALGANNTLYLAGWLVNNGAPSNAQVLTWNAAGNTWFPATGGAGGPHDILSSTHTDSNTATVNTGDLIVGTLYTTGGTSTNVNVSNSVAFTWTWAGNSEGWTTTGNVIAFTTNTSGWSEFIDASIGADNDVVGAGQKTFTWEDLGVPANATVTAVQVSQWQRQVIVATNVTTLILTATLVDSSNNVSVLTTNGTLAGASIPFAHDSAFVTMGSGSQINVGSAWAASNSSIKFFLELEAQSKPSNSGNVDVRFTNLQLTVYYTIATTANTGGTSNTLWARLGIGVNSQVLVSNGTAPLWSSSVPVAIFANNAGYLDGVTASSYLRPVSNTAPANGQTLLWSEANGYWYPANAAAGTSAPVDDGNSGASKTIDWSAGADHYLTLTANCTLTLSNPTDGGRYLILISSGTGAFVITWPANVKWGLGGQPLNTQYANATDMFTMIYKASANAYFMSYNLGY